MSIIKEKNKENVALSTCEEDKDDNDNGNNENNYVTPEMVLRLPTITDSEYIFYGKLTCLFCHFFSLL